VALGAEYAHATLAPVVRVERAARVECRMAHTQTEAAEAAEVGGQGGQSRQQEVVGGSRR
jgi:hypothetical protein